MVFYYVEVIFLWIGMANLILHGIGKFLNPPLDTNIHQVI
jgi:hypothetical protein